MSKSEILGNSECLSEGKTMTRNLLFIALVFLALWLLRKMFPARAKPLLGRAKDSEDDLKIESDEQFVVVLFALIEEYFRKFWADYQKGKLVNIQ